MTTFEIATKIAANHNVEAVAVSKSKSLSRKWVEARLAEGKGSNGTPMPTTCTFVIGGQYVTIVGYNHN
jgi:hypothetical protein